MLLKKILVKLSQKLNPNGFSAIQTGIGKGIYFSNQISDTRYVLGSYETEIAEKLVGLIKLGYSFIDVGANVGYYSMLADKNRISSDQIFFAIEPFQKNIDIIKTHFEKNSINKVEIIQKVISNIEKKVEFSATENHAANTYLSESEFYHKADKVVIDAVSLDSICANYSFDKLVIKIDVEGAEWEVLEGMKECLTKFQPKILLATHECHVKGIEKKCIHYLKELGYTCTAIDENKFVEGQSDYWCEFDSMN